MIKCLMLFVHWDGIAYQDVFESRNGSHQSAKLGVSVTSPVP